MLDRGQAEDFDDCTSAINKTYRLDEKKYIPELLNYAKLDTKQLSKTELTATALIKKFRIESAKSTGIDSFLMEYSLSSEEGIALMCLAEALLRVPDVATIDGLIKDKLGHRNWRSHKGKSASFFVNATTWGLILTGKVLSSEKAENRLSEILLKLLNKSGEGFIRKAVDKAMRIMSQQFVMGKTIEGALKRAKKKEEKGYLYSYDMLGEAALTQEDAKRYIESYRHSIIAIGESVNPNHAITRRAGISIKLSALHPKYHEMNHQRALVEMVPVLLELAQLAKHYNIGLTIDAEESERLMLSLDIIKAVYLDESLNVWEGLGIALQSYQKRAFYVLDWLCELSKKGGRRIMVRLIKGAYWDSEIKSAQEQGLIDYPVFTRKVYTDVSFQACAKKLLSMKQYLYPQFATHNAYSVAMILELVGDYKDFEFQCLHGMGDALYEQIVDKKAWDIPCRIYAPVGFHEDLLPYLVRRLLENGANSSFVNRIADENAPIATLIEDPIARASALLSKDNLNIPLPENIFMPERKNSKGFDLTDRQAVKDLQVKLSKIKLCEWKGQPLLQKNSGKGTWRDVFSPQNIQLCIGSAMDASSKDVDAALNAAANGFEAWSSKSHVERAACALRFANLLEAHRDELYVLLCLEAGKTWPDAIAEVREAIDFCYYYAEQSKLLLGDPIHFKGYTGETNVLSLHPRGIVLCISPWNFPLAIFTGQIIAALLTGNCAIAKPAEQTPLIATKATSLMHEAGFPKSVVQLLPGSGETIGAQLVADKRISMVVFTGSVQTAHLINRALAQRPGPIVPFIAETGGQNAMIVDSSALLEQVTVDVLLSAFGSAGQRCSALRVLYIQDEIFDKAITFIKGAMAELEVGDPQWISTDVGPVIDKEAQEGIVSHIHAWEKTNNVLSQCNINNDATNGFFVPPTLIEISSISDLPKEIFGPVLHVIRYKKSKIDSIISQINEMEYGLTFGIHSRINHFVEYVRARIKVGNFYVNRNMTGAIVGLQPFGGEGLSGTGPKAGGPHYLVRFCVERHCTIDTTAAGGNASLMSIEPE
jgi:RHH-type proline utilization regulon transcriptional repressor/proline dehydrogenase/delta 1-pyrroline-5-carboxylate dehydrogenase